MRELAKRWLSYATTDLRVCEHLLGSDGLESGIAFHAQQAIEKSYKAILVYHDQDPPRIHDLTRLASLVSEHVEDRVSDLDLLDRISQYYIQSRYPLMMETKDAPEPDTDAVESMVSHAKAILAFARSKTG